MCIGPDWVCHAATTVGTAVKHAPGHIWHATTNHVGGCADHSVSSCAWLWTDLSTLGLFEQGVQDSSGCADHDVSECGRLWVDLFTAGIAVKCPATFADDSGTDLGLSGVAAESGSQFPRFVASGEGIIDTESPALRQQIGDVVDSMRTTGSPPPGVRQGGLRGKPGVYGNKGGELPTRPEGYYHETDVWPGTGPRDTERIVVGNGGEAWYSPDHYGTFRPWPW